MATYTYALGVDTPLVLKLDQLQQEINDDIQGNVHHISAWLTTVSVVSGDDLTDRDINKLEAALANHQPRFDNTKAALELVDMDGDSGIRVENNPDSDEDVVIIRTEGQDRVFFGGTDYHHKVFVTLDDTGSDWIQHQINNGSDSAYLVLMKSSGTINQPAAISDGTKVGGLAFALDDGNDGATARYGAEIAAYAKGNQTPTNGGAEVKISITREGTKGRQPVATMDADDIYFHQYPSTRNDGIATTALYVDGNGKIKHGPIATTGGGTGGTTPTDYQYVYDQNVYSTYSTTYVECTILNTTPLSGGTYVIEGHAIYNGDSTSRNAMVQMFEDGSAMGKSNESEMKDSAGYRLGGSDTGVPAVFKHFRTYLPGATPTFVIAQATEHKNNKMSMTDISITIQKVG